MDQLEEIKSKIDIVDFIQEYLPLKKSGRNFKALCPFHTEKTPSFMVSPEKQIWHCFGCGEGGDIFTFLMKIEGIEFGEALRILAQRAGVKIISIPKDLSNKKERLYRINELAAIFYHKVLLESKAGKVAYNYLQKRKLQLPIIKEFYLGYAPLKGDILVNFLLQKGFNKTEIINAGLGIIKDNRLLDLFRGRIIFPLRNLHGDFVGFTGRTLSSEVMPKYLNTPQTLIFDKGKILYDLFLSKEEVKQKNAVILVEGQMDVLASYQSGIKNVVCSSGTALTEGQIDLIKRFTNKVFLAFDQDEAGEKAILRSIDLLIKKNIELGIINIPQGKDPDECIRENPAFWRKAVDKPQPFMDFYFQKIFSKINKSIEELSISEKKEIANKILLQIKKFPDKIEQSLYVKRLAEIIDLPEKALYESLESLFEKDGYQKEKDLIEVDSPLNKANILEETVLGLVIKFWPEVKNLIDDLNLEEEDFQEEELRGLFKKFREFLKISKSFNYENFIHLLKDSEQKKINLCLLAIDYYFENLEQKEILKEVKNLVKRMKKNRYSNEKKELEKLIKKAELEKNKKIIEKLINKLKYILNKEKEIENYG